MPPHVPLPSRPTPIVLAFLLGLAAPESSSQPASAAPDGILREALVIASVGRSGRNTLFTDALETTWVTGRWLPPSAGDSLPLPDGTHRTWSHEVADAEGWFSGRNLRGGYLAFSIPSKEPRVMILQITGHSMAYVGGEPRAGDLYAYGHVHTPIQLEAGTNTVLVATGRGRLRAQVFEPRADVYFNPGDNTLPDLRAGDPGESWGASVVVNATTNWVRDMSLKATAAGVTTRTPIPTIPPLGLRKVAYRVPTVPEPGGDTVSLELGLIAPPAAASALRLDTARVELRVRARGATYKRTFLSAIDGSVQYYAVQPAIPHASEKSPALFLSLHGASVEAIGQADAYSPKRAGAIVCPTNRRPYGFDWEEWGRLDALEVLDLASSELGADPSRTYLTGHSMGGHGTWNLGATFPDRFAAIGPSAGWISFFSYAGSNAFTNATPVEAMLRRAAASSDTLLLATNYLQEGVYVLHGDADDNVPVREARRMREVLETFHRDFDWHEQAGAGHWWDDSDEPGAGCVDWAPMFDFFARHRRPADVECRHVRFVTVNPGVSSRSHWTGIEAQETSLLPSEIDLRWDPQSFRVTGTTRNVERLVFERAVLDSEGAHPLRFEIDGSRVEAAIPAERTTAGALTTATSGERPWTQPVHLEKQGGQWTLIGPPPDSMKNPRRNGPFKDAFRHRVIFVFGTHGTPEENAWSLAKARFDAESFWYRGNGSIDVIADTEFDPAKYPDRGVILYGHRDMNAAWNTLLASSPVQVSRGEVRVGSRRVQREDAGCLFLQPRRDSKLASVAVVAGTGLTGLRLTNRLPYFLSGTGYPDCLVIGPEVLAKGTEGIIAAGYFGNDWEVSSGDFAWHDEAAAVPPALDNPAGSPRSPADLPSK